MFTVDQTLYQMYLEQSYVKSNPCFQVQWERDKSSVTKIPYDMKQNRNPRNRKNMTKRHKRNSMKKE